MRRIRMRGRVGRALVAWVLGARLTPEVVLLSSSSAPGVRPGGRPTFLLVQESRQRSTPYRLGPAGYPALHPRKWPWPQTRLRLRQRPRTSPFSAAHRRLDRRDGGSVVVTEGAINRLLPHHRCHSRESGNPWGASDFGQRWIPAFAGMTVVLKTQRCYRPLQTTKPPLPFCPAERKMACRELSGGVVRAAGEFSHRPGKASSARAARRAGTVGHASLPSFLSCNKKEGRPPGRTPGADVNRRRTNLGASRSPLTYARLHTSINLPPSRTVSGSAAYCSADECVAHVRRIRARGSNDTNKNAGWRRRFF